jgi:hypothetical protein
MGQVNDAYELDLSTDGNWVLGDRSGGTICIRVSAIAALAVRDGYVVMKLLDNSSDSHRGVPAGQEHARSIDAIRGTPKRGTFREFIDRLVPGYKAHREAIDALAAAANSNPAVPEQSTTPAQ